MIPRTPPLEWRIRVWSGNAWNQGAPKETLTPENGPMSIDALNITPQGDSLDGSFTLVPAGLNIEARDSITVEIHDGSNWRPRYAGIITTAGNPRSTDRQTYRTAGIRQRLFETINQLAYVDAGDVAAQVRAVLAMSQHQPAGMTYTASDVPDLGFQLGPRATAYETVGDFLDAMAGFVGTFAVPPGQTYTYDGHTYQPGEIVPPTQWGVRPDGSIYFRRPAPGSAAVFSEGDQRTTIEWAPINAEDATGDVLLLYLGALNTQDIDFVQSVVTDRTGFTDYVISAQTELTMQPIARLNGRVHLTNANTPAHATRHQVDGPVDLMDPVPMSRLSVTMNTQDVTNPNNAIDGNPATFTRIGPNDGPGYEPTNYQVSVSADGITADGVWRIRYQHDDGAPEDNAPVLQVLLIGDNPGPSHTAVYQLAAPLDGTTTRTIWVPCLSGAKWDSPGERYTANTRAVLWFRWWAPPNSSRFLRIYEIDYYVPDCDLYATAAGKAGSRSARYADAQRREPAPEVARITYHGDGPQTHEIQVRPLTGGTIQAWTERITLAMTTAAGITTTYHAGQEWPAQVQEQRILLERLARRSVTEGGRRR